MAENDPQLYFADDGAPRSGRFGDIYYSLQDGLSEARAVFLAGCHLPEAWRDGGDFSVLELGFGTGLNIAALIQAWMLHRPANSHLHVFSIEGFVMRRDEAQAALGHWPELSAFSEALLAQWPKARRGFHYMDFPQWGVSVTVALMDVRQALRAWDGRADAVFLDGFSPALNPDMWSQDVFALVAARAKPGARLATFTVAGFVRRGLQSAGFEVDKRPGFGRKRERLEAVFKPGDVAPPVAQRPGKIAVIGAGIAGCALVHQARLMGLAADIFDAEGPGSGASGNAAALVTPRLDAGDNEISALFADAFAYACGMYHRLCPQAILGQGVHQCEATDKDASRFARIQAQAGFAEGDVSLFAAGQACDIRQAAGISLNTALWIAPETVLEALLGDTQPICARIVRMARGADGRTALTAEDGRVFDTYDAVVIACGDGIFDLEGLSGDKDWHTRYDLRPVRGQVERVSTAEPLQSALSWGGYAIPLRSGPLAEGFIFGATHEREDRGTEARAADRARNLDSLAKAMPERAEAARHAPITSRASVRVMTRDYLPVVGHDADGIWLMTGLGARGFCLAPLLAKAVLAEILGAPQPLPLIAKNLLNPKRLSGR